MADTYTSFIDDIRFGGFNAIEYADEGLEMYISFQALLRWVSKYPNMFSGKEQIIEIDWKADKPMFVYSTTVSCNLQKCYIQNEYLNTTLGTLTGNGTGIGRFDSISEFNDPEFTKKKEDLEKEANPTTNPSIFPSIGNINYVYLNINFLSQLIAKGSDNKDNKVTIRKFLQDVCDGVNKALGSINDLQVISNVDRTVEKLTIIDYQQKRIKNLVKLERPYTELKAQGLGSMLTKIQAQSSITPDLASMIAIGAQAQGQVVGPEAASFTKLSEGFIDRIYPEKNIGDSLDIIRQEKVKEAIENRYKNGIQSYVELIKNQQPKDGLYDPIILESTEKSNKENIAVELYKACLEKFTETRQTSTAFIPIKLNLSLYGLSGIKIYQNFKLSNDILPLSYKGNFVFTTLGVSHTVDSSKWETNISALIGLKDEKVDTGGDLIPFTIPLPDLPTQSGGFSPGSFVLPGPAATSPTGKDFEIGSKDYALQVNPNKIGSLATTGNAPVAKDLASRGLQNANLNTGDKSQLVSISGADRNFKKRYGAYLLHPFAASAWENAYQELRAAGIIVQVYSAYRDLQHQKSLGSGTGVAGAGTSPHGWGMALDISPFNRMAKYVTVNGESKKSTPRGNVDGRKTEFYRKVGEIMAKHHWYNPWRLADNAGNVDEIWHWEYWGPAGIFVK